MHTFEALFSKLMQVNTAIPLSMFRQIINDELAKCGHILLQGKFKGLIT